MKIAITADVHLRADKKERFMNLENILKELKERGIKTLIIAGDLFDKGYEGYIDFDELAKGFQEFEIYAIPGNHDSSLDQGKFSTKNVWVYSKPETVTFDKRTILFLPYRDGKTMGDVIEESEIMQRGAMSGLILISHGDYGRVRKNESGNEEGYFPLTATDIKRYGFLKAVMGHIHTPCTIDNIVIYPGSPYPLDINETGQRRIVILETEKGEIEDIPVQSAPVYLHEGIFVIPGPEEHNQIEGQINNFLQNAEKGYIGSNLFQNLILRVLVGGYITSREGIEDFIREIFNKKGITLEKMDISSLKVSEDEDLDLIAKKVSETVYSMTLEYSEAEKLRSEILKKALNIIYS